MTRKKPIRHLVKPYKRNDGTPVRQHVKGRGIRKPKEKSVLHPSYLEPTEAKVDFSALDIPETVGNEKRIEYKPEGLVKWIYETPYGSKNRTVLEKVWIEGHEDRPFYKVQRATSTLKMSSNAPDRFLIINEQYFIDPRRALAYIKGEPVQPKPPKRKPYVQYSGDEMTDLNKYLGAKVFGSNE
jgi:hypothetical protein